MTKAQHTPGPWETFLNDTQVGTADTAEGIAALWRDGDEQKANARLIAAAPELLDELERILKIADHAYSDPSLRADGARALKRIADAAEKALTKARGQA